MLVIPMLSLALTPMAGAQPWTQFARTPQRASLADALPNALGAPRWVLSLDREGNPITFAPQTGVIADRTRVFATGRVGSQHQVLAVGAGEGAVWWAAPVPAPVLDSWSTPALDAPSNTVLVASGRFLTAFDGSTGAVRWQTQLARTIVNASPLILESLRRAFITDYDGFGGSAQLYCLNLAPAEGGNPWEPGEVIWSVPIGGASGNTPACAEGVVYVASVSDETGFSPGRILAFPADANSPPPPLWTFTNPVSAGFFGGVSVSGGSVYAASYALAGGHLAANLVKLDASTGSLIWSVPSNRTDATPIPLPGGRVLLSAGIRGFGSAPSLELFQDHGASASLLWDSALATWSDANGNGVLDTGEYLALGGWTHQPIATPGEPRLLAGAPPLSGGSFAFNTGLYLLDLTLTPSDPGFILDHAPGTGGTPAASDGSLYSVGAAGLSAFGPAPCYANCDLSTAPPVLNVSDFTCFLTRFAAADPYANCDGSTIAPTLNVTDFTCFLGRFAAGCP